MRTTSGSLEFFAIAALAICFGCSASSGGSANSASGGRGGTGNGGVTGSGGITTTGGTTNGTGGTTSGSGGRSGAGGSTAGSGGSASGTGGTNADGGGSAGSGGAGGSKDGATASEGGVTDAAASDGGYVKPAPMPSAGCGMPAGQALAMYVRRNITVKGTGRIYDVYLPNGYDPMRAYPLIFASHGCDGSIPFHIENVTKTNAIIVAPRSLSSQRSGQPYGGGCFDTGPGSASLTEVDYFDTMIADVEAKACIDKQRVFMQGHSSGSWLSHLLGCARGGVESGPSGGLRGQGNTAGGTPVIPKCTWPVAAILAHDMKDDQNVYALGVAARDRLLMLNGCSNTTMPWDYDDNPATPSPCVMYQGCKPGFPVVWCPTDGKGHSDQVGQPFPGISTTGFWKFWSQL